jgi:putative transcriptional regulator
LITGDWIAVDATKGDAFTGDPDDLWAAVLRRQGGDLALLAGYPPDPSLN